MILRHRQNYDRKLEKDIQIMKKKIQSATWDNLKKSDQPTCDQLNALKEYVELQDAHDDGYHIVCVDEDEKPVPLASLVNKKIGWLNETPCLDVPELDTQAGDMPMELCRFHRDQQVRRLLVNHLKENGQDKCCTIVVPAPGADAPDGAGAYNTIKCAIKISLGGVSPQVVELECEEPPPVGSVQEEQLWIQEYILPKMAQVCDLRTFTHQLRRDRYTQGEQKQLCVWIKSLAGTTHFRHVKPQTAYEAFIDGRRRVPKETRVFHNHLTQDLSQDLSQKRKGPGEISC